MKKHFSIIAAIMFAFVISALCVFSPADVQAADHVMFQEIIEKSEIKSEDSAYILFTNEPEMRGMSFEDGSYGTRYTHDTFNEPVYFGDMEGRQVWKENFLYMRFDPSFCSPEDSLFKVEIDYWDYSGIGWFFVDYTTADSDTNYNRVSVLKEGNPDGDPKWHTLTFYLTDASFRQAMPYGCDLKIVTNAFNAFSRIEVTNLANGKQESIEELGTFNTMQENALKHLGLYEGVVGAEEYEAGLDKFMTREEFIRAMLYAADFDEEAIEANLTPKAQNVDAAYAPYVAYAESIGVILPDENFDPKSNLKQKELLAYYGRLFGLKEDFSVKPYQTGCDTGLIQRNEAFFQMEKNVTRDNFVGIAANALLVPYKCGQSLLEGLMDEKKVTGQMIFDCGYGKLFDWMITKSFYLGHDTVVDEMSGRTYNVLDFFDGAAIKNYFTMPLTSADDTRFYFRDASFRIYEYNMVTGMCTYIDTGMWNWEHSFVCDGQNNFYYLNQQFEFIRMDCDDHSKKEVVAVWPVEQRPKTFGGIMLQTTYDGKWLSINAGDQTGFLQSRYCAFPVCNTETGEWNWFAAYYGNFKHVADGYVAANHGCINPIYPNLQFFAHEGAPVWDRVWVVDMDTQTYKNVSGQRMLSVGDMGLTSACHEFWCHCGQHIGWAASGGGWVSRKSMYPDQYIGGYAIANWDGSDLKMVSLEKGTNHPSISPDHRWGVGDTSLSVGNPNRLYLYDLLTGENILLCAPPCIDNPGHPHPQFSWDGTKVFFGCGDESFSYSRVGWIDISDIIEERQDLNGGQYDLSDSCETFGYEGFNHYIEPLKDENGETYYRIPKGNKMNVNIKPAVVENWGAKIKLKVTYLDKGKSDVNLHYKMYTLEGDVGGIYDRNIYLERNDTGKWITKELVIDSIDTANPMPMKTDIQISGVFSDAHIKSVEAECLGTTDYSWATDSGGNGGYVAPAWDPRYPR